MLTSFLLAVPADLFCFIFAFLYSRGMCVVGGCCNEIGVCSAVYIWKKDTKGR